MANITLKFIDHRIWFGGVPTSPFTSSILPDQLAVILNSFTFRAGQSLSTLSTVPGVFAGKDEKRCVGKGTCR